MAKIGGQTHSVPGPAPPKDLTSFLPQVDESKIPVDDLLQYQRAACYMAASMIFLRSNCLLDQPITKKDIKLRLLGHWGTCPGLVFAYSHSQLLVRQAPEKDFIFVTGPGHGAPAILACLYLEGAISKFYPSHGLDRAGLSALLHDFSFPGSHFPSHVNAETPGSIHEGGELGYALATAYGSVMDKPDRVTVVVVGDGESETGPTA